MRKHIKCWSFFLICAILISSCGVEKESVQIDDSRHAVEDSMEVSTTVENVPSMETDKDTENTEGEDFSESDENTEQSTSDVEDTVESELLDVTQKNSIAMLNYLAVLSQEINASKNSRLFLEEAYASLINNTNPEKVNELTESHLSSLLDIIEEYRMINVKRERLQCIYEQSKAMAIKEALPNPLSVLKAASSFDLKRLVASTIYTPVDSISSYRNYNSELDQAFLQDGWEFDDKEATNMHDSRKRAFLFMVEIVREDGLPGQLALNENSVNRFVEWKNNPNIHQKIQFYESEEATYAMFGNYWLELATCYYENREYSKCLKAVEKYEELQANIFRKDYCLAQVIPKVIASAREEYAEEEYIHEAERYLNMLLDNTESNEWSLRYFAAEIYLDLYSKTGKEEYLRTAYEIALNNVNNLVAEQLELNRTYLNEVDEVEIPENAGKDEKKQIKEYNKSLHELRKTELPPIYEPLVINCELLFGLAKELNINEDEKNRIEGILRGSTASLFLNDSLEYLFSYSKEEPVYDASFDKSTLIIPVSALSEKASIEVTVTNAGKSTTYRDWEIKKVERDSGDIKSYAVTYMRDTVDSQEWSENTSIKVVISQNGINKENDVELQFKVSEYKEVLFVKTIEFEQVK